jgi:hypothetical protein
MVTGDGNIILLYIFFVWIFVTVQVLTAASMKMTVVCSFVETDRRFSGTYRLHLRFRLDISLLQCMSVTVDTSPLVQR